MATADESTRRPYRPLSVQAMQLLREQPNTGACDLFFPSTNGGAFSRPAFKEVVKRIAGDHALASSFSSHKK
jgi:hypothetical protein